jgi:midasin (ATPase involved in ribosome maturation)
MIVQNLSLQTDSTDLLVGYRQLELQYVARNIYDDFFTGTSSRKQNAQVLQFASTSLLKELWQ